MRKRYPETGFVRYLTSEEFKRIEEYVGYRLETSPPAQMIFYCMMYLGLRVGEAIKLRRENFNEGFSRLTFAPLKKRTPKIHQRLIPEILQKKLIEYDKRFKTLYREGYLFPPYNNQSTNSHIQCTTIHFWCKRMREDLKLGQVYYRRTDGNPMHRLSAHTFRHYFAWRLYTVSNHNIKAVQEILDHEKYETTANYINALESSNNKLEKFLLDKAFKYPPCI